jgi:hypothetical protein
VIQVSVISRCNSLSCLTFYCIDGRLYFFMLKPRIFISGLSYILPFVQYIYLPRICPYPSKLNIKYMLRNTSYSWRPSKQLWWRGQLSHLLHCQFSQLIQMTHFLSLSMSRSDKSCWMRYRSEQSVMFIILVGGGEYSSYTYVCSQFWFKLNDYFHMKSLNTLVEPESLNFSEDEYLSHTGKL